MRSYRLLTLAAGLLLTVEFVVGLAGEIPPRREYFPFASWVLFAQVPHAVTEYDLEFTAADGVPLTPPLRFSQAARLVPQPHSIAAFEVIQRFGQALEKGDVATMAAARRPLEAACGPARLRCELVAVTYDPVPRYETGAVRSRRVLGTFTTQEPVPGGS